MRNSRSWFLILFGTIVWSLTMVKSGLLYDFGLGFWGANGHDALWHISLAESFSRGVYGMPMFSEAPLQNYHFGFDLLLSVLHVLTRIPVMVIYFQILPPLLALGIGYLTYRFVLRWTGVETAAWWSTFFVYFGSGLGWMVGRGESVFWSQQSLSTLINPPFALSLVLLLGGLTFWQQNRWVIAGILFGLLLPVKVYAGILVLFALLIRALFERRHLKLFLLSLSIGLSLFLPFNRSAGNLIEVYPGWFLENMFTPDRLDLPRFLSAINTYRISGNFLKLVPALGIASFIFLVGNLGLRLLGIAILFRRKSLQNLGISLFLLVIFSVGLVVPHLFIQKGTAWNTIQFFYYSLFVAALFAGFGLHICLTRLSSVPLLKYILSGIVIALSAWPAWQSLGHYLPSRPPAKVSAVELEALSFLATEPAGIVLTRPFDQSAARMAIDRPPRPLYLYESTAYVSALSRHSTFLEDEVNLNITGYDWQSRRSSVEMFFTDPVSDYLTRNNIKYLYLTSEMPQPDLSKLNLSKIFQNSEVLIYRVP